MNTLIGIKQNMTSKFNELGKVIPVTTIVVEPNIVVQTKEDRIQIAYGRSKKVKKPQNAYVNAVGFAPRVVKEVRLDSSLIASEPVKKLSTGDQISVSIFKAGDIVKITGITKGHGFAGGVKRWGFHGGPKTHGQSDRHRAPGSIGQTTTPGRVFKGKHMAGHYGAKKITTTGLEVIDVDQVNNLISVRGAIPGWRNGLVVIEKTGIVKNHVPLYSKGTQPKAGHPLDGKAKEESEEISTSKPTTELSSKSENQSNNQPQDQPENAKVINEQNESKEEPKDGNN